MFQFAKPASNRAPLIFTINLKTRAGVAHDLTGATFTLGIRAHGEARCRITATIANGMLTNNGADGTVDVNIPRASMVTLEAGTYSMGFFGTIPTLAADEKEIWTGELPVKDGVVDA